jgi:hypothetical protein
MLRAAALDDRTEPFTSPPSSVVAPPKALWHADNVTSRRPLKLSSPIVQQAEGK